MVFSVITIGLTALLVFYLPGWLISRVFDLAGDTLERIFDRVLISVLLSGWLALTLASCGVFHLWLHLGLLALLCAILALWWWRRGVGGTTTSHTATPPWELAGYAIVGLITLVLLLPPFEMVLGVRDAGIYANSGFAIARTGSLVQHDALVQQLGEASQSSASQISEPAEQALSHFLGVQHRERFIATRMRVAGFFINDGEAIEGRIVPQHLHLLSAWVGLLTSAGGWSAGLFAPGLMALLGAWSVGMLGRRLAGPWVGLLAVGLLALNGVQVWFGRYTTAETTAQMLTFAGLYSFTRFQQEDRPVYAALAGIAFGQLVLNRIDFFLVVGPVMLYLGYCFISHRWQRGQTALALGLLAMLFHAALHIAFIARAYFFDTAFARLQDYALTSYLAQPFLTPVLREVYHTTNRSPFKDPWQLWRELLVLALTLLLVWAIWRWPQPLRWFEQQLGRWQRWLVSAFALAVVLLAAYAYLIRPQILSLELLLALPGCLLPHTEPALIASGNPCLLIQGYVGAPIALPAPPPGLDLKYMIPLANFVRFGWYLSPLGILLGVIGWTLWWLRGLNRASWLALLIGLGGVLFFVRDTYGTSDQTYIYILRRFVPIAYPAWSLWMAYALVAIGMRVPQPNALAPRTPLWRRSLAAALAALLIAFFAWTGRPIYGHTEYQGALDQLNTFAEPFTPGAEGDILLFRGGGPTYHTARDVPDLVVTPLHFTFGLNAFSVKSSEPGAYADVLAQQIHNWQAQGHTVYLVLSASGGSMAMPGFDLQRVSAMTLDLPEFEQLTEQKPQNVAQLVLPMAVYRLEEGSPGELATLAGPLTATDFAAQVQGFYLAEALPAAAGSDSVASTATPAGANPAYYAWTDGEALLRLAWDPDAPPSALRLTAAGGQRPAHLGPAACA